jgi:3-phosphoshikimate 1-carboxyvinyltransferase
MTIVCGRGLEGLQAPDCPLDAGNSGTTLRILTGVLAGQCFQATISGDRSLRRRPMDRVIEPLKLMGAQIESDGGRAPLTVRESRLRGISYELPVASSQVKSSILLAGLYASGPTTVIEPIPTRDHTERMLVQLGVDLQRDNGRMTLRRAFLKGKPIEVPGDPSAASFLLAAATLIPGAEVILRDVGVNPTRIGFFDVLRGMGAEITVENERERCGEPRADLAAMSANLKAVEVGGDRIPGMIDELPLLAVVATQAQGRTVIRDAQELGVKETDRVRAVTENLRRMGAVIEEKLDGWVIDGPQRLTGACIDSFDDHRIVMAFAVAGLLAQGETSIRGVEWADISFPGFFELLARLTDERS